MSSKKAAREAAMAKLRADADRQAKQEVADYTAAAGQAKKIENLGLATPQPTAAEQSKTTRPGTPRADVIDVAANPEPVKRDPDKYWLPIGTPFVNILGKNGLVNIRVGLNFGHKFDSNLTLEFRKLVKIVEADMRNASKPQPDKYHKASFSWRGGVRVIGSDGIEDYQLTSLIGMGWPNALDERIKRAFPELCEITEDDQQRVVMMIAEARQARIQSTLTIGHFKQGPGAGPELDKLCQHLWRADEMNFCIVFLLPKELKITATEYLKESGPVQRLCADIQARRVQWWPYFTEEGRLKISTNMPSIDTWANRGLCRYSAKQMEEIQGLRALGEPLPIGHTYPLPANYTHYSLDESFQEPMCLVVPAAMTVIREHQMRECERLALSRKPIVLKLMKPFKSKNEKVQKRQGLDTRSNAEHRQESSFYLFGSLNGRHQKYAPELNSVWNVEFIMPGIGGKPSPGKDNPKWTVYCKEINDEEKTKTQCDFLLVGQKPAKGVELEAVGDLKNVANAQGIKALIEPVVNDFPINRVVAACEEFMSDDRDDLDDFILPFCGERERHKQSPTDLTSGHARWSESGDGVEMEVEDDLIKDESHQIWKLAIEALRPHFTGSQMNVLDNAFSKVVNKTCLVLGGSSSMRTTMMATVVAIFALLGHKIVVHAKDGDKAKELDAQLSRLREAHSRALKESEQFNYPTETSMTWHVEQLIREVDDLQEDQQDVVRLFKARRNELNGPEIQRNRRARKELANLLAESSEKVMALVIDRMDVVVATYIDAGRDILRKNFNSTISVHTDANRTKLGSLLVTLTKKGVKAHIFAGDPNQQPPSTTADAYNEFRQFAARSSLNMMLDKGFVPYWLSAQQRSLTGPPGQRQGRVTYAGPEEGGMFGGFPTILRKTVQERHVREGAHKPRDPPTDLAKPPKRKGRKPKNEGQGSTEEHE